ncbi:integrase domain-containing protein [Pseudidiomarina taiwanensis]|uniref:Integrase n=1 Tax=Pseudidiomarina taiwanensis TaxID=337250 RepID=A0A432ZMJ1_9GAMM|nr:integrase domain-containing protein [Pseudidiomarina taiwanensis]RUO79097.1 integrase [Pseudidiomarina taiwanensis]
MARVKPLTNTEVKQAKPRQMVYKLSDGGGLQLRIRPNGNKSWLLDYIKPNTKKRSAIGLGGYPALSLADARKQREIYRELLVRGIDPKDHKDKQQVERLHSASNTFMVVSQRWFEVKQTQVSRDYADDIWRSLEKYILPKLANHAIDKIRAPEVIDILRPVSSKGNHETVKRLCQRLNEVMVFAVNTGLVHSNPLSGLKAAFPSPVKSNMPALLPKELPMFLEDLSYASVKIVTRLLIEWQLHTMVRPNEAAGTRWSELDLEQKVWVIPASRMKRKQEHIVPLTDRALEIIQRLRPISGESKFLFPSDRHPSQHTNSQTANMAIKRMGYAGRLVAHGMRSIASTTLNEQGFAPDIIEAALAHTDQNQVRRAYNRSNYLDQRRAMMQWWSDHIEQSKSMS